MVISVIMRKLAKALGKNERKWELVGLLHDLDYDMVDWDMSKHGIIAAGLLAKKMPKDSLYAIKSHDNRTGIKPNNMLGNALVVADTLALIVEIVAASGELTIKRIRGEIEISEKKPWYMDNMLKVKELGFNLNEVLRLGIESARDAPHERAQF